MLALLIADFPSVISDDRHSGDGSSDLTPRIEEMKDHEVAVHPASESKWLVLAAQPPTGRQVGQNHRPRPNRSRELALICTLEVDGAHGVDNNIGDLTGAMGAFSLRVPFGTLE
ncbi:hypothetical protein CYMTET_5456 [Cymbomonas tetramitiformis]|uniref:Uncharacterized protein n=1 Tax=Cymbomonas tetramitiformis TaxID=36881 RepID=A0AAE0GZG6_9CHLO|nr:hypothetical protein CYMTET_5456 [Cymbomonas tetramitiformis]